MYGRGYVIEHCVASFRKKQQIISFATYITDGIKIVAENSARINGGSILTERFIDIIRPEKEQKKEKTQDEIIQHLRDKLG